MKVARTDLGLMRVSILRRERVEIVVRDALTTEPVPAAEVSLHRGFMAKIKENLLGSHRTSSPVESGVTDSDGTYVPKEFAAGPGVKVKATGYIETRMRPRETKTN